ncbi:SMR family transporter, partial [Escherichia coli]|uniref:SMR family transporter n=2 Tax=Escherichia coli TaxID=562 RepID=UPI0021CC83DF
PAYGPQNDVTLKMPAFEWVHVQLHQQKGMISLSPPTICNSAVWAGLGIVLVAAIAWIFHGQKLDLWAFVGMGLIVSGVAVLNLLSKVSAH